MALKMILASLEGVDDTTAALYKERDGKFELQVEGGFSQIDVDKLRGAANAEREISKGVKAQLAAWGDRNPEETIAILDKVPEMEILIAAGKNKLDNTQVEALAEGRVKPIRAQLEAEANKRKEAEAKVAEWVAKDQRRTILDTVRALATESKAKPESYATELGGLMLLAERLFTINEQGVVVSRDGAPDICHGLPAKEVWGEVQKAHSYLWPDSQGGGASGGSGGSGGVQGNPFKANNMTERGRFVRENANRPEVIANAMKAAGLSDQGQTYIPPAR